MTRRAKASEVAPQVDNAEMISFDVHPAILQTVISAQSGTLHKAILELIMNSVDAGATRVDISLDAESFAVTDDGTGFKDEAEVKTCFRMFGEPQTHGKTYGRFRIGRGQCFEWGVLRWASGTFCMDVNTRQYGLNFHFLKDQPAIPGCRVTCSLYNRLDNYALQRELETLTEMTQYVRVPLTINGVLMSKNPYEMPWEYETSEAFISLTSNTWSSLDVYNQGVLAVSFPFVEFGCGGVVVSKLPLTVNFARNDILLNHCDVWRKISRYVRKVGTDRLLTKKTLSPDERASVIKRFRAGEFLYQQIRECPILTDIAGVSFSFKQLLREKQVTVCFDSKSIVADRVQSTKMARVLSGETLHLFQCSDLEAFTGLINGFITEEFENAELDSDVEYQLEEDLDALCNIQWVPDISTFDQFFNGGFLPIEDEDLPKKECIALRAIRRTQKFVIVALFDSEAVVPTESFRKREIFAGESDSEAWTDGSTSIWITRQHLAKCNEGVEYFQYICQLLAHEYLHDSGDCEGHQHGADFHEAYHRVSLHRARKGEVDLYIAAKKWPQVT